MRSNLKLLVLMTAVVTLSVACGSGQQTVSAGGEGGGSMVAIAEPEDGAQVQVPFTMKFSSSDELGPTESGRHHVHVFFDGNEQEYTVVESDTFTVEELPPGEHTIGASLRNADHSPAGAETEITVVVAGAGGGASTGDDDSGTGPYDYDY